MVPEKKKKSARKTAPSTRSKKKAEKKTSSKTGAKRVKKSMAKKAKSGAKSAAGKSASKSTSKVAAKKPAAGKAATAKKSAAGKKTAAATAPKSAKRKASAGKSQDEPKRVVSASLSKGDREVLVAYPQSTLEGTLPHEAHPSSSAIIAIHSAKYEVTPPERVVEPVYPEEGEMELPERYNETRLVLMPRDPEWMYMYWEVSDQDRDMIGVDPSRFDDSLVVRLHDVSGLDEFNGINSTTWYEIPVAGDALSWYVHLPEVDREWVAELGVLNDRGEFIQLCRSNRVRTPRNSISSEADSQWMAVSRELTEILARSADTALKETRMGTEAAIRRISQRLHAVLEQQAGSPGASMAFQARQRGVRIHEEAGHRDLPLHVRTELVVSGSTDPQAKLKIRGEDIDLRPDGTFTVRYELPDGEQIVDVRAVTTDGELTREVVPVVQKSTR